MKGILNYAVALVAGAAAMYYLDPEMGRRRRALARDKAVAGRHDVERFARTGTRRVSDQLRGAAARARDIAGLSPSPANDQQMAERIRAQMGRLVSRPGAVEVAVADSRVCLSGHVLAGERQQLVSTVAAMSGVESVDDQLQVHDEPGNIPELQGGARSES